VALLVAPVPDFVGFALAFIEFGMPDFIGLAMAVVFFLTPYLV